MEPAKLYTNLKVGKPVDATIEITGEVPAPILEVHRKEVLEKVKHGLEVPGFRKGNVPEAVVLKHVNMNHVLEDAAEEALNTAYPAIIDEYKLAPQSAPRITLVKLALGSPLEFKMSIAVEPEVTPPNYKKIAAAVKAKAKPVEVTERDVDEVLGQLLTMRSSEGAKTELTDEFVKTLGKFENVADFKAKLKENIKTEKEDEARRLRYEELAQELAAGAKFALSPLLIEDEVYAAHGRLHRELEKRKMSAEEYFKIIKKTEEEYMKEKKEAITRQLKTKFILKAIAAKENIKPDEKEVETELQHAARHYPNANPEAFRAYIEEMMANEKTLKFLEEANWK